MVTIFISYSHADEELRRQLDVHLAALRRQGVVDIWHDRKILAGEEFANEIDGALSTANIILLLVSADFINSDYCFSIEMTEALQRHERHEAVVIPVILRACDWHDLPFGKLRATPTDGKPVRLFADLDSAFLEVVRDIKAAALKIEATGGHRMPALRGPRLRRRFCAIPNDQATCELGLHSATMIVTSFAHTLLITLLVTSRIRLQNCRIETKAFVRDSFA